MTRWNWKRWAFAIVTGTALAGSFATLASDDMPKAGETITLKFPGQADRVVTVVKSTRKTDGSLETEVKDGKTGDTFTLIDPAPASKTSVPVASIPVPAPAPIVVTPAPVPAPAPIIATPALPPLPKPVAINVPVKPVAPMPLPPIAVAKPAKPTEVPVMKAPMAGQTPMPPMAEPRDKRLVGGGKVLNREPEGGPTTVPTAPVEDKRPGILGRVFGGKKPTPPVMPATSLAQPAPVSTAAPMARTSNEPPRVQPVKPVIPPTAPGRVDRVVPPTPVIPPISAPSAPDAIPIPLPTKPASIPLPPAPPAKPTIPPIAIPAAPVSSVMPAEVVRVANQTPVAMGLPAEVEPHAVALKQAFAPSTRLKAAKDLATGPYAATEAVKGVLFHTAKNDLCPAVKADCIEHLAKLGYRDPAFLEFVKTCCSDESGEVRMAAKNALATLAK